MADDLGIWAAGDGYVPVLPQLQLYQLRAQLRVHPILERKRGDFHLSFNLRTGEAGGFNNARQPLELGALREAPATHPRVQQLYLVTDKSPWYVPVHNAAGITVGDIINAIAKEYRRYITEWEWSQLSVYNQERVRRAAIVEEQRDIDPYYTRGAPPPAPPEGAIIPTEGRAYKRSLWLREYHYLELLTHDDKLVEQRFGFKSPDTLVMIMGQ
ncbi:hypothetical protein AURDEDRAFT_112768 [Auricularia subglabra TFB-10046 SS5]|nr:hypothetical protein AURDEDRAFT_112768 [Auricularia subglabra TFB-10046 SS5]